MWLAHKLGLKKGMRVLDVGCGVGGPMRTIARCVALSIITFLPLTNEILQIFRGTHCWVEQQRVPN